jgi:hypothetical protein
MRSRSRRPDASRPRLLLFNRVMADDRPPSPPRARAVADLPLERLLGRAEELTRRWAIGLVEGRPLETLGSLPLALVASEGPDLCRALLRALGSDQELASLAAGGDEDERSPVSRLAVAVGASDGGALVEAVEALRGAVWELLLAELCGPLAWPPRAVAEVGDRLSYACSRLLAEALLDISFGVEPGRASTPGFPVRPVRAAASTSHTSRSREAVIFDERAPVLGDLAEGGGAEPDKGSAPGEAGSEPPIGSPDPRAPEAGASLHDAAASAPRLAIAPRPARPDVVPPTELDAPTIEIRDERREEGPAAWIGAIGRQLERFVSDRRPFAVMLVEPVGLAWSDERVSEGSTRSLSHLERLLADELATGGGWLTRERPGRYWLIAPETDRIAAARLRQRLERAVAATAARQGGQAAITVGVAVCPEDGERAPALAAHADVDLYAARAEARAPASRPAAGTSGDP